MSRWSWTASMSPGLRDPDRTGDSRASPPGTLGPTPKPGAFRPTTHRLLDRLIRPEHQRLRDREPEPLAVSRRSRGLAQDSVGSPSPRLLARAHPGQSPETPPAPPAAATSGAATASVVSAHSPILLGMTRSIQGSNEFSDASAMSLRVPNDRGMGRRIVNQEDWPAMSNLSLDEAGAPGRDRTCDLRIRSASGGMWTT